MRQELRDVLAQLAGIGVGSAIIERVARLNPDPQPAQRLRGIHFTSHERANLFWRIGAIGKGEFLRRYGRERFAKLGPADLIKRGRRIYVRYHAQRRA
jgi:hypothetical protein